MPCPKINAAVFVFALLAILIACSPAAGEFDEKDIGRLQNDMQNLDEDAAAKMLQTLKEQGISTDDTDSASVNNLPPGIQQLVKSQAPGGKKAGRQDLIDTSASGQLYWFFIVFLSITGMGFFSAGKRSGDFYFIASGLIMMIYPYFVTDTLTLVLIGVALTVLPFVMSYYGRP